MNRLRASRLATWITFFVIALAALAPTVSRALAASGGGAASWQEVCTASGMRWVSPSTGEVAGDGDPAAPSVPAPLSLDHCPFCLTGADRAGLPTPSAVTVSFAPGRPVMPAAGHARPRHIFPVDAARPRGPPSLTPLHLKA